MTANESDAPAVAQGNRQARADLEALIEVLDAEIAAIEAGALERVGEFLERKSVLVARVEAAGPLLSDLAEGGDEGFGLLLRRVSELISRDQALLERLAETTAEVAAEIARIRDRHSLSGVYEATGRKREKTAPPPSSTLDWSV